MSFGNIQAEIEINLYRQFEMAGKHVLDGQPDRYNHSHKKQKRKQFDGNNNGPASLGLEPHSRKQPLHLESNPPNQGTTGTQTVAETVALLTRIWDNIESSRASMEDHAALLGQDTLNALKKVCQTVNKKRLARSALDVKRPETIPLVSVPPYERRKPLERPASVPPLPPIAASHLAEAPFTHASSRTSAESSSDALTYERLEFLGDAYLEIIASRLIYSRFTYLNTGQQSALRQLIVKNETLAKFALQYGFDKRIKASHRQDFEESTKKTKILADMFEAYVAAVVLSSPDTGFETAEAWMTDLWAEILLEQREEKLFTQAKNELAKKILDQETKLEYLEERPSEFNNLTGVHDFYIGVYFTGWGRVRECLGVGKAGNKPHAGMRAAADAFNRSADIIDGIVKKLEIVRAARRAENKAHKPAVIEPTTTLEHSPTKAFSPLDRRTFHSGPNGQTGSP